MVTVFSIIILLTSLLLIALVLTHRGQGGGLSDLFGGASASMARGSSVAEKNLTRYTTGVTVIWFASVIALGLTTAL